MLQTQIWGPHGTSAVNLALDTGASSTLLSWDAFIELGYDPSTTGQRIAVTTGSGIEYCPHVNVDRLRVLGKAVPHLSVLCHGLPARSGVDGLLGLNFLRRFDLRVNFKQGFITLR